ncbi:hypothetical protein ABZT47_28665 [Sphaerisporangium sp. NPDC005289]
MILDRSAREAAQHGLAHQLRSIEGIQRTIQGRSVSLCHGDQGAAK